MADIEKLYETLSGEAKLDCIEPNLQVILKAGSLGHLQMCVCITPDHMTQEHRYLFELDQSYLPSLIQDCRKLIEKLPIVGSVDR